MAVVFISPKQRQKVFFLGIAVIFLLFLVFVFFIAFFSAPPPASSMLTFNKPKVNIDMSVFNSDQFKKLQPFTQMQTQYSYTAATKDGKQQVGFISAASESEATTILQNMGLIVAGVQEAQVGRDNPFTPYSQTATAGAQSIVKAKTK